MDSIVTRWQKLLDPICSNGMTNIPPVPYSASPHLPVTTTFTIDGYRITKYLGIVRGLIVRSPTISQGILGGLKSIIGGNIGAFTQMCEQTRQQAYDLLIEHAIQVGANAIVGFRYDASEIGGGTRVSATEVLCYGTAVVIEAER
jgi:uncharacterized protein YbjQ (UPF0145 family)